MANTFHSLTTGRNKPDIRSHREKGLPSFKTMRAETEADAKILGKTGRESGPHPATAVGPNLPGRTKRTTGESHQLHGKKRKY
jgi:hypothetical protein